MTLMQYFWRVVRVGFSHSLSVAQSCIFVAVLLTGAAIWLAPKIGASIDLTEWTAELSGWKVAATVIVITIGIRLLLAPFWIHLEMEERLKESEGSRGRDSFDAEGGSGGEASAHGAGSWASAEGGAGATVPGKSVGGAGGGGHARGESVYTKGGAGGGVSTPDGRGGRGVKGQIEDQGGPSHLWRFGSSGSGGNHPEFDRRLALLEQIFNEYFENFPERARYVRLGIDLMPERWINVRPGFAVARQTV